MTIHFIGAGPGAADLLTLRGRDLIHASPVCLYAGSLVPKQVLAYAKPGARLIDSAEMNIDEIVAVMATSHREGLDVARVHSGDLSIWSTMAEQTRRLALLGIPFDVTPGVPAFAAAAAAIQQELTLPQVAQTLILTRTATCSTPMPEGEDLVSLGRSGGTMAIHLSITNLGSIVRDLLPAYGSECAVIVVHRASWPDELILRGTMATIEEMVTKAGIHSNALILIGRSLVNDAFGESFLYSPSRQRDGQTAVNSAAHVLLLGGTSESWELAALLSGRSDVIVVSSLAGRVSQPRVPTGLVRVGGFGGVDGLIAYLKANKIAAVIDATHPFAVRISQNAEAACKELALPLIALARPAWVKAEGDIWHEVEDFHAAASLIERMQGRVFLSIGRQELAAFADCRRGTYLIRAIEQPTPPLPLHHRVILERGPFDLDHERKLLCEHSIDVIVSKNSGGTATYSKIAAARDLRLPVVMISQPPKSTGRTVNTVNEVCIELDRIIGNRCSPRPARATEAAR